MTVNYRLCEKLVRKIAEITAKRTISPAIILYIICTKGPVDFKTLESSLLLIFRNRNDTLLKHHLPEKIFLSE